MICPLPRLSIVLHVARCPKEEATLASMNRGRRMLSAPGIQNRQCTVESEELVFEV